MTDPRIPLWLRDTFGGNFNALASRNERHKSTFRWSMNSKTAAEFCSLMAPYMKLKKDQAELAQSFYRTHLMKRYTSAGVPEDEVAKRREMLASIQKLNRRGAATGS